MSEADSDTGSGTDAGTGRPAAPPPPPPPPPPRSGKPKAPPPPPPRRTPPPPPKKPAPAADPELTTELPAVEHTDLTTEMPVVPAEQAPGDEAAGTATDEKQEPKPKQPREPRRRRGKRAATTGSTGPIGKVRTALGKRAMRRSAVRAATDPATATTTDPGTNAKAAKTRARKAGGPRRKPGQWFKDTGARIRNGLRRDGQVGLLLIASHPIQAVVLGAVIGGLALLSDRTLGQAAMAGLAVLLVQLALGLHNDVADAALDRRAKRMKKPIAAGNLPGGNATYLAIVLVIISIPVSLQNGTTAGAALLATLPIGYIHNRILHRTFASFAGWMATFALYPVFLAYGGWGGGRHGDDPTWQFIVIFALVGLCAHLATSLPDLVGDNAAGTKGLPLRIALKIGAPRLLVVVVVLSVLVLAGLIAIGIDPGLRQW